MDGEIHRFRLENPEFQIPERTKENTLHITQALLHSLMWKPRPRMCVGERKDATQPRKDPRLWMQCLKLLEYPRDGILSEISEHPFL